MVLEKKISIADTVSIFKGVVQKRVLLYFGHFKLCAFVDVSYG